MGLDLGMGSEAESFEEDADGDGLVLAAWSGFCFVFCPCHLSGLSSLVAGAARPETAAWIGAG